MWVCVRVRVRVCVCVSIPRLRFLVNFGRVTMIQVTLKIGQNKLHRPTSSGALNEQAGERASAAERASEWMDELRAPPSFETRKL